MPFGYDYDVAFVDGEFIVKGFASSSLHIISASGMVQKGQSSLM